MIITPSTHTLLSDRLPTKAKVHFVLSYNNQCNYAMSNLLTDESPQVYHPTMAAWIGLNEAIFLAQLNFILTKNDTVGKFADGKKWYRDQPRAFMVKYFPFWDESIVKRTIANLRNDGLLLVRADLNTDKRDKRSLWYSINYDLLERLEGPVDRINQKSEKRKEARQARPKKEQIPEVQIVPEQEVQNVPVDDKSTNSTFEQVQNVPTPKDSLPKDSDLSPIGDSGQGPPIPAEPGTKSNRKRAPLKPAFKVFIEVTSYWAVTAFWREKMAEVVGESAESLSRWRQVTEAWTGKGWFPGDVKTMLEEYYQKGRIPGKDRQNGASHYGSHQRSNEKPTGESLANEPTFNPYTGETIPGRGG